MMSEQWPLKPLNELCEFRRGLTYKKGDQVELSSTPVLRATNISLDSNALILDDLRYISNEFVVPENKRVIPESILMCIASGSKKHLGKVAFVEDIEPLAFGGFMGLLVPKPEVCPKYLYYSLISPMFRDWITKLSDGTNINNLNFSKIENFQICLPPLGEQQRIVGILDDAFENIRVNKNQIIQKKNGSRELLQSMLKSTFDGEEGWTKTTIGGLVSENIIEKPLDGNHGETHPKKAEFVESGVPFLMAVNLKDGVVDCVNCNFITRTQADSLRKGFAKDGDILISHKGTIGRVAELETDLDYVMLTPQITYYRVVDQSKILPRYLYTYFQSPEFVEQMTSIAGIGSTRAYIGITKQLELTFRYPSIEEQKTIIQRFDSLSENVNQIEQTYQQELNSYDELKKSILQEAFSGQI